MPDFYLFGGPNGAGKTTAALQVLPALGCKSFLNADLIAHGLSPLNVEAAAYKSGSLLLRELRSTAEKQIDFATESTLAAHSLATNIQNWQAVGYQFHLFYIWLPSADMAVRRVESRVKAGGHNIPVEVIRRRYERGRRNFLKTYMPLADVWMVLDNSKNYEIVAEGTRETQSVFNSVIWEQINE